MATKTSVIMETTDSAQNKSSRSITYIDPDATSTEIKDFVVGLNGLTNQTLTKARRVDTTDILNDDRQPRNLKMSLQDPNETPSPTEITSISSSQVPSDANSPLTVFLLSQTLDPSKINIRFPQFDGYYAVIGFDVGNWTSLAIVKIQGAAAGSIVIDIPADNTYLEETITLTITAD